MAEQIDDRHRQVVPRWWPFETAAGLGELQATRPTRAAGYPSPPPGEIEELVRDWKENRSSVYAAGVLDAALAYGLNEVAAEAAQWILANGGVSPVSTEMARVVLEPQQSDFSPLATELGLESRWRVVAELRRRVRAYPRDPLLWVDVAREYASLGQVAPASKSLTVAQSLAPHNRFVLRSASRFYLHARDPDKAHSLLERSDLLASDPWVLAAEIAAAQANGRTSRHTKVGERMVESGGFPPRSLSELAGAIGTLELEAGNRKRVRKLFEIALTEPTENTVAQASWVSRHMPAFEVPESSLQVPRAFEAAAWEATRQDSYDDAVEFAAKWLKDEPFATRPVLLGSWVAAIAKGDYRLALGFVDAGEIANPGDIRLTIQRFYCLASLDQVQDAVVLLPLLEEAAASGHPARSAADWEVLIEADKGLLAFRSGDLAAGRAHYSRAIDIAAANGLRESGATAYINYLREESRIGGMPDLEASELEGLAKAFPEVSRGAVSRFIGRILGDESPVNRDASSKTSRGPVQL